jgi:hypothetical protein
MNTAVEWLADELCYITDNGRYIIDNTDDVTDVVNQAKQMEKEQDIYLLRWMAANVIEVQGGWEYDGWTYSDEGILEVYYKQ